MSRRQRGRQRWFAAACLAWCLPALALAATKRATGAPDNLRRALELSRQGHEAFLRGDLAAAEAGLLQAAALAPEWPGPHGALGALYHQRWFGIRGARDREDERLREQAMAEYALVQAAGSGAIFIGRQELPWIAAGAVLAPARGLLGATLESLERSLGVAATRAGNGRADVRRLLPLLAPGEQLRTGTQRFRDSNRLPRGRVRPNDGSLAKQLKELSALLVELGAVTTWEVNQRRLESDRAPLVPDAYLTCLARAFGLWAVQTGSRRHQWREERFALAYPDIRDQWNVKETLSWAESKYGSYLLSERSVRDSVYRLFKSPGHYEALMDRGMRFIGPACVPTHEGAYVIQIQVVGPPPTAARRRAAVRPTLLSGTGAAPDRSVGRTEGIHTPQGHPPSSAE